MSGTDLLATDLGSSKGAVGDGKKRALREARAILEIEKTKHKLRSSLVVVLHDSDGGDQRALQQKIKKDLLLTYPAFPSDKLVVLIPHPKPEAWIVEVMGLSIDISKPKGKALAGSMAFQAGKVCGDACASSDQGVIPPSIALFCEQVRRALAELERT